MTRSRDPWWSPNSAFDLLESQFRVLDRFEAQFRTKDAVAASFDAALAAVREPTGILGEIDRSLDLIDRMREAAEPAALREARAMELGLAAWRDFSSYSSQSDAQGSRSLAETVAADLRSVAEMSLAVSPRPEYERAAQLAMSRRGSIEAILSRAEDVTGFASLSEMFRRSGFDALSGPPTGSSFLDRFSMPMMASIIEAGSLAARSDGSAQQFSESFAGRALAMAASVTLIEEPDARREALRELARWIAEHANRLGSSGLVGLLSLVLAVYGLIVGHQEGALQRQEHANITAELAEMRSTLRELATDLAAAVEQQRSAEELNGRDIFVVRAVGLRLRQGPSNRSRIIRTLQMGESLDGLGWKGRRWIRVSAFNVVTGEYETGWVAKTFVRRLPRRP